MKEGGGGDHLSVGVRYPGGKFDRPISKNIFLTPGKTPVLMCVRTGYGTGNGGFMIQNFVLPTLKFSKLKLLKFNSRWNLYSEVVNSTHNFCTSL